MRRLMKLALALLVHGAVLVLVSAPTCAQSKLPQRILSIGGDVTEILYALGAGQKIVAVDSSSQFPSEALREKKSVGYMRALAPEGVLSVGADLVIATDKAGPADVVRTLKSATTYVEVAEGHSADGVAIKIRAVARAVGKETDGEALASQVTTDLAAVAAERQAIANPLRALFVLNVVSGRATVGGAGTNADAMLKLAGLANAADALQGFKPVGDEALLEMRPDIVITMKPVSGGGLDTRQLWSLPGLIQSPAGAARRVIEMDGLYLLGFGPRVGAAARDLMRAAYISGSIPPER